MIYQFKYRKLIHKRVVKNLIYPTFIILCFTLLIFSISIPQKEILVKKTTIPNYRIKTNGDFATLDLTNPTEVNNSKYLRTTTIPIKGRLYNRISGDNKSGYEVAIKVDDILYRNFNDTTNSLGQFKINYTIHSFLSIGVGHKINVTVINETTNNVEYWHHYIIYVNSTSFFDIDWANSDKPNSLKVPGETFTLAGTLRMDDGTPLASRTVFRYWKNNTEWADGSFTTNFFPSGLFSQARIIPTNVYDNISLKFVYNGELDINASQIIVPIKLFSNITCNWNTNLKAAENEQISIRGQVVSRKDGSVYIANRDIRILYDGAQIGITTTDSTGNFTYPYTIPDGIGLRDIQIELISTLPVVINSSTIHTINITVGAAAPPPSQPPTPVPFEGFLVFFIPIISVIIGVLIVVGILRLKKQEVKSRSVKLPLEEKINNMKILKQTGRIEEALSYLFIAIYMDLVNAKFGRKREVTETIRDFAIISVKELNLSPTAIYPFITKVEEIIYARPFSVTDKDFYDTIGLFSPIYYELTGYNFKIKF